MKFSLVCWRFKDESIYCLQMDSMIVHHDPRDRTLCHPRIPPSKFRSSWTFAYMKFMNKKHVICRHVIACMTFINKDYVIFVNVCWMIYLSNIILWILKGAWISVYNYIHACSKVVQEIVFSLIIICLGSNPVNNTHLLDLLQSPNTKFLLT